MPNKQKNTGRKAVKKTAQPKKQVAGVFSRKITEKPRKFS